MGKVRAACDPRIPFVRPADSSKKDSMCSPLKVLRHLNIFNFLCMVDGTYFCEQLFSQMNVVNNKLQNRLTQDHLMCQLRTSIHSYYPRFDNIQYTAD